MRKTWFLLFMVVLIAPSVINLGVADADFTKAAQSDTEPLANHNPGPAELRLRQELAGIQRACGLKEGNR